MSIAQATVGGGGSSIGAGRAAAELPLLDSRSSACSGSALGARMTALIECRLHAAEGANAILDAIFRKEVGAIMPQRLGGHQCHHTSAIKRISNIRE